MPDRRFAVAVHRLVDAGPDATYRAIHAADLLGDRVVRGLFAARELPDRVVARLRGEPLEPVPRRFTLDDVAALEGWTLLGEEPGVEIVLGSVGRFWERDYGWVEVPAEEWATFAEPGYAKTVAGLSIRPYGDHRTLVSYESRTTTTDEEARRRFRRYWWLLRPFLGIVMSRALDAIRREAESRRRPR
ncbi:MAG: hypothetical protein M5U14_20050 [Acidimicrobiia bacterium]|nr:hypothetical protein [Acidimicrobiia bacterium]